ncbi:helix-turn-helix domain-containing protein [Paraburkholderia youngii]|uniref:helix-turn-helix domain-containing protein n=1 Tax=Paraburkholderia youngii TaxID=2782701 RepID=UPI003D1AE7D9
MSVKVMSAVFERYPEGGGEMILALALADHAHDDGSHIYPSVETLAEKTRQSERAVQYQLRRMEKSGWLILVGQKKGGRGNSREYRINAEWINGAELAPISERSKGAKTAPNEKGANGDIKGATGDTKGAKQSTKGCKAFAPESLEPSEPSENHQPARRAPRILRCMRNC